MPGFFPRLPGSSGAGKLSNLLMNSKSYKSCHVIDLKLSHQARPIGIDRLRAQRKPGRDLFGSDTVDQERKNLELPAAEVVERVLRGEAVGALRKQRHHLDLWRNVDAALHELIERVGQLCRAAILEQVATGPASQSL